MANITYKESGVDIDAGDRLVDLITPLARSTFRPEVLSGIGGFGALVNINIKKYKRPVLVSGTDGVGTKLKIAFLLDRHDTVGIDLVAMCVNDILTCGAEPLFFLDYFATGKIIPKKGAQVIKGIVEGCRQAGCALVGGETAEMPGFYKEDEYDLAGFAVGIVDRKDIIDGSKIRSGDCLIGLASSGLHSNGYSLVRKVLLEIKGYPLSTPIEELGKTLGEELLTPTRIYVKLVLSLMRSVEIKGIAHITGGGITENIPRVLPKGCQAAIRRGSWDIPPIFGFIQKEGEIDTEEMYRDFNMGIGLILIVSKDNAGKVISKLKRLNERPFIVGEIKKGARGVSYV